MHKSNTVYKALNDRLELCELPFFYQLFGLSFWWHPFTVEDPMIYYMVVFKLSIIISCDL